MVARFSLLLLLLPSLLLAACSDDDDNEPSSTNSIGAVAGSVIVDFTGAPEEKERIEEEFSVDAGSNGWDAIKDALGEDNVSYQDHGGQLGILITGFEGVEVEGNHFWEFKVNGETAEAGVSSYEVQPGDVLEFVYSSF